jgi:hypothetical protein
MGGGLAGARCATRAGAVTRVRANPDYTPRPSPRLLSADPDDLRAISRFIAPRSAGRDRHQPPEQPLAELKQALAQPRTRFTGRDLARLISRQSGGAAVRGGHGDASPEAGTRT